MFTDKMIRDCYERLVYTKANKKKAMADLKADTYKQELDSRADAYKRKIREDALKQMELIDKNTEMYKQQIDIQNRNSKVAIDNEARTKLNEGSLDLGDLKEILNMLYGG